MLETGLRRKELVSLKWAEIFFDPVGKARRGYVHVRGTKSKNSKRNLSLTASAREILSRQQKISRCEYVFVLDTNPAKAASASALDHCHARVRKLLGWSEEFVLHSLRHTFGTRLGEAGTDAFTIMRIMGHSSITVSQRYVHPTPETMEKAFDALQVHAEQAAKKSAGVATIPATVLTVPRLEVQ
jgi:integrase